MFEHLNKERRIIVTGPQRSGTTACARMIARDAGLNYIDEDEFNVFDFEKAMRLMDEREPCVIQGPGLFKWLSLVAPDESTLVIVMRRPVDEILASQRRIGWTGATMLACYPPGLGLTKETLPAYQYEQWDRRKVARYLEIEYDSLKEHPMWVPKEKRAKFRPRQWQESPVALLVVPTLDGDKALAMARRARACAGVSCGIMVAEDSSRRGSVIPENKALNLAVRREVPYIVLLNDDLTTFTDGWLKRLIEVLETDGRNGIAGPSGHCREIQDAEGPGEGIEEVKRLSFFCAAVRRGVFEDVGLFDSDFVHYGEDSAFCMAARAHGWRCQWVKDVYVGHEPSDLIREWKARDLQVFVHKWGAMIDPDPEDHDLPRVLWVDTLGEPGAQMNTVGLLKAWRRHANLEGFDYRTVARANGQEQMNRLLEETARWHRPDLVHLGKCESVWPQTVKRIKETTDAVVVHVYGDVRDVVQPWVAALGKEADWTLLPHTDEGRIAAYRDAGCRRIGVWRSGVDPEIFCPRGQERDLDVVFLANLAVGQAMHPEWEGRLALVEAFNRSDIPLHVFGHGWRGHVANLPNVTFHDYAGMEAVGAVLARAKIAMGWSRIDLHGVHSWPRMFCAMASGALYLVRRFPGLEDLFGYDEPLETFADPVGATIAARIWLEDDEAREKVATEGMAHVLKKHTWESCVKDLLALARVTKKGDER